MPIRELLKQDHSFSAGEVAALVEAFESCLRRLRLKERSDPVTTAVARVIIELAKKGERDPERLCERAIRHISD
jgi:hypothetical protein